jgi:hypothetical protein
MKEQQPYQDQLWNPISGWPDEEQLYARLQGGLCIDFPPQRDPHLVPIIIP